MKLLRCFLPCCTKAGASADQQSDQYITGWKGSESQGLEMDNRDQILLKSYRRDSCFSFLEWGRGRGI